MAELTPRQREVLDLVNQGFSAPEIARRLKPPVSRNAVYLIGQRLRDGGWLPSDFTFGGAPMREKKPSAEVLSKIIADSADSNAHRGAAYALIDELRRTRDDLDSIVRRLSRVIAD